MSTETTKLTVLQRIRDLKNMVDTSTDNISAAMTDLNGLREQGDIDHVVDRVTAMLGVSMDSIGVLATYYQKQIDMLKGNNLKVALVDEHSQPVVQQTAPVTTKEEKMTQVEGPRPGSAAWRIQQRLAREQQTQEPEKAVVVVAESVATPEPAAAPATAPIVVPEFNPSRTRATRSPDAAQRAEMNRRAAELAASVAIKPQSTAPAEDNSLLPSVVEDEPQVQQAIPTLLTPPNMYQRMTTPKYSPLWRAFAASPWFPEGTGLISIGQQKWPEITKELSGLDGRQLISCAQGFYIKPGETMPSSVLIRMRTFALLWDFKNNENSIMVFQIGLSDKGTNDYKWFPLTAITSGSIGRLIAELNTYLGTEDVPFNPMG